LNAQLDYMSVHLMKGANRRFGKQDSDLPDKWKKGFALQQVATRLVGFQDQNSNQGFRLTLRQKKQEVKLRLLSWPRPCLPAGSCLNSGGPLRLRPTNTELISLQKARFLKICRKISCCSADFGGHLIFLHSLRAALYESLIWRLTHTV
jgi:hypothetical protein